MGAVLFLGAGWSQKRVPDIPGTRTGPVQLGTGIRAHCLVAGIASHGSSSLSRGQLATTDAPTDPRHPSFTQCDGCLVKLVWGGGSWLCCGNYQPWEQFSV